MCSVNVEVEGNSIRRITGNDDNPVFKGYSCAKGRIQGLAYDHPHRLRTAMKRQPDGSYAPIPVDVALDEIADRIRALVDAHGPRSIALYAGSYWFMDHPGNLAIGDSFMHGLGSPMSFSPASIDQAGRPLAMGFQGRWMAPPQKTADVMLIVGNNPYVSHQLFSGHPGKFFKSFFARDGKLIVVDPRRTELAKRATLHLQVNPGEDPALLTGMIRVLLDEELFDAEFVAENVTGVERLRSALATFTLDEAADRCGVPVDQIAAAARMFASQPRGIAIGGTGANMSGLATLVSYLLSNLDALCGHYLRAGDVVPNALTLVPAAMQGQKAQAAPPFPSYGFGATSRIRGLSQSLVGMPTAALAEEILMPGEGQVKALISLGGSPLVAWPDQQKTVAALEELSLIVQTDITMSPMARMSHYVLPTTMFYELPGTTMLTEVLCYGPQESYAQYTPAVIDPPAESDVLHHHQIIYRLAQRLGLALEVRPGLGVMGGAGEVVTLDMQHEPTADELLELVHGGSRVPLDEVKRHPGGALFPDPPVVVQPKEPGWEGRLDVGNEQMMSDFRGYVARVDEPDFPYRLVSRRMPHVFNSPALARVPNRPTYNPAYIHPDDLSALGLASGDLVMIESPSGRVAAVTAADETMRPGVISMAHGYGDVPDLNAPPHEVGSNTGALIANDRDFDPYSGQPRMSAIPVRLTPAEGSPAGERVGTAAR